MKISSLSAFNFLVVSSVRTSSYRLLHHRETAIGLRNSLIRRKYPGSAASKTKVAMSSLNDMNTFNKNDLTHCPKITLKNGLHHPAIGFGTYKLGFIPASASSAASSSPSITAEEAVSNAIKCGYRFIECAQFYGNEQQVGKAIAECGIPREEIFICSKVWTTVIEQGADAIRAQVEKTLSDLRTDYLDLYLIHWPVPGHHVQAYKTLEELYAQGKFKAIGLSNYAVEDYQELKDSNISVPPVVNQIEINPFLYRRNTIDFFKKEGIVLQSYRSLRDGKAFNHPTLVKIGSKYKRTPAQILGRWCVQKGFVYVPKSAHIDRMIENAQVFDFCLQEEDMEELNKLTTPEALNTFLELYRKCVNRDTSKDGTLDGVKMQITVD